MKKVSIIIPVYNEKATIAEIEKRVKEANVHGLEKELIIVDDFSQDGTREILTELQKKDGSLKIIYHTENQGKGAAVRTGKPYATGDIIILQDADLEYNPDEYYFLIKPILARQADVIFGSRFMGQGPHRVLFFWHYLGNRFLTLLSNTFTNLNLTDMETCYKIFTKEIFDKINIEEKRFGIEPELTAKVAKLDCRIFEVGISYFGRKYSEGKKINWKDGVKAIYCIIKYNLFRHN